MNFSVSFQFLTVVYVIKLTHIFFSQDSGNAKQRPELPVPCSIIKDLNIKKILESFQNVAYIGALRQKWEEIKKLTKQPNLTLSTA